MTPLRQRMLNDMTVRGLAENTKKPYLNAVTGLARHYRRSPDNVSAQELQDYLIHLHVERGLAWKSCNCARHGIRFFYRITLGLPEPHFYLPGAKTPSTLPEILNHDELLRLFTVTTNPKHRAVLMTAYAAGFRSSELTRLVVNDVMDDARTGVDVNAVGLLADNAPADPVRGFQHPYAAVAVRACSREFPGRGQPGRTGAHDQDIGSVGVSEFIARSRESLDNPYDAFCSVCEHYRKK